MLGVSVDVVKELEKLGRLTPVRLAGPRGLVHYRAEQVHGLVNDGGDASTASTAPTVPFRRGGDR